MTPNDAIQVCLEQGLNCFFGAPNTEQTRRAVEAFLTRCGAAVPPPTITVVNPERMNFEVNIQEPGPIAILEAWANAGLIPHPELVGFSSDGDNNAWRWTGDEE